MAFPTIVGVGAVAAGQAAITPAFPGGYSAVANDIAVTFRECENADTVTVPAGWAIVGQQGVASGTTTKLSAIWKRLVSGDTAPSLTDAGDHQVGRMIIVRGCTPFGDPWDLVDVSTELTSDTSVTIRSVTTSTPQTLLLLAFATGRDVTSTAEASAWTNANLAEPAITEQIDNWNVAGTGGGVAVAAGGWAPAGATGDTTATVALANFKAMMTIALKPLVVKERTHRLVWPGRGPKRPDRFLEPDLSPRLAQFCVGADSDAAPNATTVTVTIDHKTSDGDIGVLAWYGSDVTTTPPEPAAAGWTLESTATDAGCKSVLWTKTLTRSEAATNLVLTSETQRHAAVLAVYDGVLSVHAVTSLGESGTDTVHASPTQAISSGEAVGVAVYGERVTNPSTQFTPPAGYLQQTIAIGEQQAGSCSAAIADDLRVPSAVQVGGGDWVGTQTVSNAVSWIVALTTTAGAGAVTGVGDAQFGFTGTASGIPEVFGTAVANLGFTGTANGIDRALGTATAAFGFTGTALGVPRVVGAAAASLGFTGTALGEVGAGPVTGVGTAAFGFTGTAAGIPETFGVATASLGFPGAANGIDRALGQAVANLGYTGTAAGIDRALGQAVASFGFTGTASGIPRVRGAAVANLGFTGTASGVAGTPPVTGQATALFGYTGTALGVDRAIGQAIAAFGYSGAAVGHPKVYGQAVATLGYLGQAAGLPRVHGQAIGALGFTGIATAISVVGKVTVEASTTTVVLDGVSISGVVEASTTLVGLPS